MATFNERVELIRALMSLDKHFISKDVPSAFTRKQTVYGLWLSNRLRVVNSENGADLGIATFKVFFHWKTSLFEYRIEFSGGHSQYLNRKHCLKECLAERMDTALTQMKPECKTLPEYLFVGRSTPCLT